jgi:hypothetical protein
VRLIVTALLALVTAVTVAACQFRTEARKNGTQSGSDSTLASARAGLATPATYAQTCELVGSWCQPVAGHIPHVLRRALGLPTIKAGGTCPTAKGRRFINDQFGGIALGDGPVQPLIAVSNKDEGPLARHGVLRFHRSSEAPGWYSVKTLWFSLPIYQGPVFIRGRELDGSAKIVFGERPTLVDPQLPPGSTINGRNGFREWPGATWLRAPGCYAWQVDGAAFSRVIVFRAELVR